MKNANACEAMINATSLSYHPALRSDIGVYTVYDSYKVDVFEVNKFIHFAYNHLVKHIIKIDQIFNSFS